MGKNYRGNIKQEKTYDYMNEYNKMVFNLADDDADYNTSDCEKLIDTLKNIGVNLNIDKNNNTLSIEILPEKFKKVTKRNAGRKIKTYTIGKTEEVKYTFDKKQYSYTKDITYKYSDIIYLIFNQSMTDKAIMELLDMKRATYYRHKNKMMSSNYYAAFNKMNKIAGSENIPKTELENIPGNFDF